jgi:predicted GIY-YIG superfamily endonuclease
MAELGVTKTKAYEIMRQCRHYQFGRSVRVDAVELAKWRAENMPHEPARLPSIEPPSAPGVYAIQCESGYIKIGKATDIRRRLLQLQGNHPEELRLVGVLSEHQTDEKFFHRECELHRHRGEWFRAEGRVLEMLRIHGGAP